MTRINCIPPAELSNPHLVAEYRELPRVVGLANAAYACRRAEVQDHAPRQYVLGRGHVMFFYVRMDWVRRRFAALVSEMLARGMAPRYLTLPEPQVGFDWCQDWEPDAEALALNRQRIAQRIAESAARRVAA